MKKSILPVVITMCILTLSLSPASAGDKLNIGVKAGVSLANVYGDDVDAAMNVLGTAGISKQFRTGFAGGLFVCYEVLSFLAIQPEVLYTMKGVKLDATFPIVGKAEATVKLDYIEIPVLVKLMLPIGGFKPNIFAGPSFAFNILAELSGEALGQSSSVDLKDVDPSLGPETFDFGFVVGAGVDLEVGPVLLTLDGRYTLGLTEIWEDVDIKNGVAAVMVGVGF